MAKENKIGRFSTTFGNKDYADIKIFAFESHQTLSEVVRRCIHFYFFRKELRERIKNAKK